MSSLAYSAHAGRRDGAVPLTRSNKSARRTLADDGRTGLRLTISGILPADIALIRLPIGAGADGRYNFFQTTITRSLPLLLEVFLTPLEGGPRITSALPTASSVRYALAKPRSVAMNRC